MTQICKHNVNVEHCKLCTKQAENITQTLELLAAMGIKSAKKLIEDIMNDVQIDDINVRLEEIIKEYEER